MMRRGDADHDAGRALARLYRDHGAPVFAYAFHLLGSRQDAEDVVQTAFLHAHRMLVRGERIVTPRAWLTTVVKRQAFNLWRDRREIPSGDPPEHVAASDGEDAVEELRRVRLMLFSLPEAQHQAFVLRHWSGLSNREIAGVLEITESAVESLLVRARAAILAAEPAGGECDRLRDRLAGAVKLSGAQVRHIERCGSCRRAQQRLTRIAAAAAVAGLVPHIHVAQALAASVPGFSTSVAGGAGAASGAGLAAKAAGVKTAAAALLSAATLTVAVPLAVHAESHPPPQRAMVEPTVSAPPVTRLFTPFTPAGEASAATAPRSASDQPRIRATGITDGKGHRVGDADADGGDQEHAGSTDGGNGDSVADGDSQGSSATDAAGGDQGDPKTTAGGEDAPPESDSQGDPTPSSGDGQ